METKVLVIILVSVLIVFAGIQAVQINDLKSSISGQVSGAGYAINQNAQNAQYAAPTESAPQMVGGC